MKNSIFGNMQFWQLNSWHNMDENNKQKEGMIFH